MFLWHIITQPPPFVLAFRGADAEYERGFLLRQAFLIPYLPWVEEHRLKEKKTLKK